jgi:hypothetical protein
LLFIFFEIPTDDTTKTLKFASKLYIYCRPVTATLPTVNCHYHKFVKLLLPPIHGHCQIATTTCHPATATLPLPPCQLSTATLPLYLPTATLPLPPIHCHCQTATATHPLPLSNCHIHCQTATATLPQVIPRQLCDNAGFDSTDILNQLRHRHAKGQCHCHCSHCHCYCHC